MVVRRSSDEGHTWSPRLAISPDNGNRHYANNACLVHLTRTELFRTVLPSKIFEAAAMGRPIECPET